MKVRLFMSKEDHEIGVSYQTITKEWARGAKKPCETLDDLVLAAKQQVHREGRAVEEEIYYRDNSADFITTASKVISNR